MVEVCKVSPEMEEQKNFLFFISGVTCSKQLAIQGPHLLSVSLYTSVLSLANIQGF
jgi:hypothetical protein